jgi:hypothetical protein
MSSSFSSSKNNIKERWNKIFKEGNYGQKCGDIKTSFNSDMILMTTGMLVLQLYQKEKDPKHLVPFHELETFNIHKKHNLPINSNAIVKSYEYPILSTQSIWLKHN